MKLAPIITSLLDTDLYKFSMGQAIYHQFPDKEVGWSFKCRNKDVKFTKEMVDEIKEQFKHYCTLRFTEDELAYLLREQRWFKKNYIDFLRLWQPRYEDVDIQLSEDGVLTIETSGTWLNTSMYEIPILAIVNEVYFRYQYDYDTLLASGKKRLKDKAERVERQSIYLGTYSEFGTRRRLSKEMQALAIQTLHDINVRKPAIASKLIGTSNVYFAKEFGLKAVGTMAHEWIMVVGQGNPKHNPAYSNWYALEAWVKEYGILNGIALTDTITTDCFLRDFKQTYATLFSGVRHDSGDPKEWGDKMIEHYKSLGIDPMTKTLLFSDSLDFDKANELFTYFRGRAQVAFGIGTYISNDTDAEALNIVMKVTTVNGQDVAKISDAPGKGMCKNPDYVEYLQKAIDWRMANEAISD